VSGAVGECCNYVGEIDDERFALSSVPDDGAVEELATERADPAFSERISDWCPDRGFRILKSSVRKISSKLSMN